MLNVSRPSCVRSVLFCLLLTAAGSTAKAQTTSTNHGSRPSALPHRPWGHRPRHLQQKLQRLCHRQWKAEYTGQSQPRQHGWSSRYPPLHRLPMGRASSSTTATARYTDTFTPFGSQPNGGVQQNASEYTFGYVVHTQKAVLRIDPFASGGAGTTVFRPTPGGGLALPEQARATYYGSVGAETTVLSPHFGVRAQYRQVFFKAPDFETNYLTIQQHTTTYEPGFGFFLRF